jgi:hypothetical protein
MAKYNLHNMHKAISRELVNCAAREHWRFAGTFLAKMQDMVEGGCGGGCCSVLWLVVLESVVLSN